MSWLDLEGKAAIVTGGASGIGKACCEGLAEVGVHILIADVNKESGTEVAKDLANRFGVKCIFQTVDVSDQKSVDVMIRVALDAFKHIDILVNNAGILIPRLLVDPAGKEELSEDVWDKVVAINQKGIFLCAQAAGRVMVKQGNGVIVNMASESGLEGSEGQSVYAGTKGAIYALTRSWAKELGKHGVRVVGVAPGILEVTALRSPEYERALAYARGITVEQLRAGYAKISIPLGRSGKLNEVADLVCFLASNRGSYIHGTTINISGGKSRA
ncbi:MAG: SDR family oxidoreductase [Lentisphaerae bacterium]|nr:SDR family oxidoreductase [Lentisphaerota bacterium]